MDAATELPIAAHVTTASRNDTNELLPLLRTAKAQHSWFSPAFVLADKGYDAAFNLHGVAALGAVPIIDVRKLGKVRGRERESRPCEHTR